MKRNCFVVLYIIFTTLWFSSCDTGLGKKKDLAMLELKIQIPETPIYLNQQLVIRVTLLNKGATPMVVNTRLSVGYEKSLSRELYAALKNLDTGKPATYAPNDINRDFALATDYKSLVPGDSISATFNLLEYYPLKKKGHYELTVYYQADEELANPLADIWKGILSTRPEKFEILSGRLPDAN